MAAINNSLDRMFYDGAEIVHFSSQVGGFPTGWCGRYDLKRNCIMRAGIAYGSLEHFDVSRMRYVNEMDPARFYRTKLNGEWVSIEHAALLHREGIVCITNAPSITESFMDIFDPISVLTHDYDIKYKRNGTDYCIVFDGLRRCLVVGGGNICTTFARCDDMFANIDGSRRLTLSEIWKGISCRPRGAGDIPFEPIAEIAKRVVRAQ